MHTQPNQPNHIKCLMFCVNIYGETTKRVTTTKLSLLLDYKSRDLFHHVHHFRHLNQSAIQTKQFNVVDDKHDDDDWTLINRIWM
ncbi:hypothetical protein DERP_013168 [Dermatophagoides pteronyssinus]|uniref:Uncharacterized protein n=1 Tax=Dermatophagoides pteronyssinus TaxID=6956 RepID=A0ABQ8J3E7_DERPT|nr:hypothetical protein DERP_013168 [Dermatophagoides pteronyssinus]